MEENDPFRESYSHETLRSQLLNLSGFDRSMYEFARFLQATCGAPFKSAAFGKPPTRDEWALTYLRKVGAVNLETGKSTIEVSKATGYKRAAMSQTLNSLVERGLVRQERRGKRIKYFLSSAVGA